MAKKEGTEKKVAVDPSTLDRDAIRAGFEAIDAISDQIEDLERTILEKKAERSDAVKALLVTTNGYSGPFSRGGTLVRLVERNGSYFVRGKSDKESFEV